MRRTFLVAVIAGGVGAVALGQQRADGPRATGPEHIPATQLKQAIADASPWRDDPTIRYKRLGSRGADSYWILFRDGTGKPEQHDGWNDIFVVQSGSATVLYGGELRGGVKTGPGETLGGEIVNGERRKIARDDVLILPAGTPHQFLIEQGESIAYVTIKTPPAKP
jgi:mannose-6-phosphate isomerase-like protein (cupin superfamily)